VGVWLLKDTYEGGGECGAADEGEGEEEGLHCGAVGGFVVAAV
jgi:hypothetical protein